MRKQISMAFPFTYSPISLSNDKDLESSGALSQDVSYLFEFQTRSKEDQSEMNSTPELQFPSLMNQTSYFTAPNHDQMDIQSNQQVDHTNSAQLIQEDLIFDEQSKDTSTKFCNSERQSLQSITQKAKKWNPKEDKQLVKFHKKYNGKWEEISKQIKGRNASQCFQRWRRLFPQQRVNAQFDEQTDQQIRQLVKQIGNKWAKIAQVIQTFSPKQIRDRYVNVLDRKINKEQFTNEEDQQIISQYMELGPRWKEIADSLENRTDSAVKNRFYGNLRKRYLGIQNKYQIIHKH